MRKLFHLCLLVLALSQNSAAQADTITDIRERGHLNCGVSQGIEGFSSRNSAGDWHGFDVDIPHWHGPGPAGSFVAPSAPRFWLILSRAWS